PPNPHSLLTLLHPIFVPYPLRPSSQLATVANPTAPLPLCGASLSGYRGEDGEDGTSDGHGVSVRVCINRASAHRASHIRHCSAACVSPVIVS
ncbi:hypothetical protein Ancab_021274, partial [Ancistrocladus abbreviatus]